MSGVSSVDPSSTTITSPGLTVCSASAARQPSIVEAALSAGITTDTSARVSR
jgi:hypothetical protein